MSLRLRTTFLISPWPGFQLIDRLLHGESRALTAELPAGQDCVAIVTDHPLLV